MGGLGGGGQGVDVGVFGRNGGGFGGVSVGRAAGSSIKQGGKAQLSNREKARAPTPPKGMKSADSNGGNMYGSDGILRTSKYHKNHDGIKGSNRCGIDS